MKSFSEIFSARLRELRNGESQSNFAKILGLKQSTYANYESGAREPSLQIVKEISARFGISADWLLGLTDTRTGGVSVTASGGSVAANHSTVSTAAPPPPATPPETDRLLGIIESQQRIIENLSKPKK